MADAGGRAGSHELCQSCRETTGKEDWEPTGGFSDVMTGDLEIFLNNF